MNKSSFFSGQPVFAQLVNLIPRSLIAKSAHNHRSDRYYKKFRAHDHLITMLYSCFHECTSLREVVTGLQASYNKFCHLNLTTIPRRSTLAEANSKRDALFFEDIYHGIFDTFYGFSPDSRRRRGLESRLFSMDSSTVTLFCDIMKGAGMPKVNGRKKGGVKAHVLFDNEQGVARVVYLSPGADNDRVFMDKVTLPRGSVLVFDRGYRKFSQWEQWGKEGISWVTRQIGNETVSLLEDRKISKEDGQQGVLCDQKIILGGITTKKTRPIIARQIKYVDRLSGKTFVFVTNNFRFKASTVAYLYRCRWSVEVFFKRLKQNNAIRYFLGDNENAIKIQLWCCLIKDLLIKIIKDRVEHKRKWSFANLTAMIHHHLMNYLNLTGFLCNPDKILQSMPNNASFQRSLFPT